MAGNEIPVPRHDLRRYHVVVTRTDETTAIMGTGLSMEEAKRVRAALIDANVFPSVQIMRGDAKAGRD